MMVPRVVWAQVNRCPAAERLRCWAVSCSRRKLGWRKSGFAGPKVVDALAAWIVEMSMLSNYLIVLTLKGYHLRYL